MNPPIILEEEEEPKGWRKLSLEQLSDKVEGQHKRMSGYIQGLEAAQTNAIRTIVETLSDKFVKQKELDFELEVLDERYGWIPKLLKWCGVAIGGGMLGAWLRTVLK